MSEETGDSEPRSGDRAFEALVREVARTPPADMPTQAGDSFGGGRYVVERALGRGGQKDVFVARDTALDRACALSVVKPGRTARDDLERFRLEARALARFGAHPNIVTIYDLGEEAGLPYAVCEYLDGGDASGAVGEHGALPADRVLRIARDVCRALAFAHERGVVHRDVTPGNVWLLRDGTAKLGDFGLALVTGHSRMTSEGTILGTPHYMAPEQARGMPLDARSDIYSLGCVLYELCTGGPPFDGGSVIAVVSQHVHAAPLPPRERNPAIDAAFDRLVMRMLEKDPADRPRSAGEILVELEGLIALGERATVAARPYPVPANEPGRLAALHAIGILDTPPEQAYDELAELAAQLCECPMGYICFIDETRQWIKARVGVPDELMAAPREVGICQTTICQSDVLVARDLAADERFRDLAPVASPPHFRFYAGAPLITRHGYALGTLVVMDFEPRDATHQQIESIRRLARQVVAQIELREKTFELDRSVEEAEQARRAAEAARSRAHSLLENLMPPSIAAELRERDRVAPRYHESVTIGVVELEAFARQATSLEPARLVQTLDDFFSAFDETVRTFCLEKLGTVGGRYVFGGGLPDSSRSHQVEACLASLALRRVARRVDAQRERHRLAPWNASFGLHSGPAMSGVVGRWKLSYGAWGEAVSLAERAGTSSIAGAITVSESTREKVRPLFVWAPAGTLEVPDRAPIATFRLERIVPELSEDADGEVPNARFHATARQLFSDYEPRK